jgi:putative tryptophan/tyrosine transport system substrate-binding protein
MRRRRFLLGILGAALVGPEVTRAQKRIARIGWLAAFPGDAVGMHLEGLRAGLSSQGYLQGRDYVIEEVSADGKLDRIPSLAADLARKVDVIVTQGPAVWGVEKIRSAVPIVYGYSGDPIDAGFASSLARPLHNMTGQTYMSVELNGKRIEMLRELLPDMTRLAILANPQHPGEQREYADSLKAAKQLGIQIDYRQIRDEAELDAALAALAKDLPQAIVLFPDELTVIYRSRLIEFARFHRIPLTSGWSLFAQSGALFTYGPRIPDVYRGLARYVVRILNGAKPEDLPIELPTVFELVVNLKTASAIGITVPPSILSRADFVIE